MSYTETEKGKKVSKPPWEADTIIDLPALVNEDEIALLNEQDQVAESFGNITGALQNGKLVQFRRVMSRGQQVILFLFFSVMAVSGIGLLWVIGSTARVTSIAAVIVLALMLAVESLRILVGIPIAIFAARARDPIPLNPVAFPRVAFLTTIVPGKEPLSMVRRTLEAMLAVRYPGIKDVWLLDEKNDPEVRKMCADLGVYHFSRYGIPEMNQSSGAYRAKTKSGNHNSWRYMNESDYDIVAQADPDHIPEPWFLERSIGYFNDPDTGFVVAPQVYGNSAENWIAKGSAQMAYIFEAIVQRGANGFGAAILIGTNHLYRTSCWRQIGGYQDALIEDHLTSMAVYARANPETGNRWRGVYTPDILAIGEGPTTFTDWFAQQMRWSFGMWKVVASHSPKIMPKLRLSQITSYLLLQPYYPIVAIQWVLAITLTTTYMATGVGLGIPLVPWAVMWGSSMISTLAFWFWTHRFNLTRAQQRESGMTGMALMLMTIPIYASAGFRCLTRQGLPYVITAKGDMSSPDSLRTFRPHLAWLAWISGLIILAETHVLHAWPVVLFWAGFSAVVCVIPVIIHLVKKLK
jgi:cellulose synthase (UDP-forming)